ncbi:MAG: type II toxin-antitoxin system VapC family toxin [Capsulimonas sp.]|uniref:type II toxin-antitoxin system VapC family toxin n=1 Tax=Capsulimonas sp. TaxID=2494211 RepID=UPI003266F440
MSRTVFLADTHVLLWALWDSPELSPVARELLEASESDVRVSVASIWEIGIKLSYGKFAEKFTVDGLFEFCDSQRIIIEPIPREALIGISKLPYPLAHKDPFDRIIACTCLANGFTLIGADTAFDHYGVPRIW